MAWDLLLLPCNRVLSCRLATSVPNPQYLETGFEYDWKPDLSEILKENSMRKFWRSVGNQILVLALLLFPVVCLAADFELFWDPNCNEDPDLEGYYIYYLEDASVVNNPDGAMEVYVPLSENGFDISAPSYLIPDLIDDVRYCFSVTAWYGDEESGMSNEVCGINGDYTSDTGPDSGPGVGSDNSSGNTSNGGCFIGALK
jgi:hypothetical protein